MYNLATNFCEIKHELKTEARRYNKPIWIKDRDLSRNIKNKPTGYRTEICPEIEKYDI